MTTLYAFISTIWAVVFQFPVFLLRNRAPQDMAKILRTKDISSIMIVHTLAWTLLAVSLISTDAPFYKSSGHLIMIGALVSTGMNILLMIRGFFYLRRMPSFPKG